MKHWLLVTVSVKFSAWENEGWYDSGSWFLTVESRVQSPLPLSEIRSGWRSAVAGYSPSFMGFHLLVIIPTLHSTLRLLVGIVTGYGLDDRRFGVPSPGRVKTFHFSTSSIQTLGSTQPPIQWVPGALSLGAKLTTRLHLVPRSRKCGSVHRLPHTPSWRSV
jgi:hypothetical protein